MTNFNCVVNCGGNNPNFPAFFNNLQNFGKVNFAFDDEKTTINGSVSDKAFGELMIILDKFKLKAKVKKNFIH